MLLQRAVNVIPQRAEDVVPPRAHNVIRSPHFYVLTMSGHTTQHTQHVVSTLMCSWMMGNKALDKLELGSANSNETK